MSITRIELSLWIGPLVPLPAPAALMCALRRVEVTQRDSAPSGFQLSFLAEKTGSDDFAIVQEELLRPFSRVLVRVTAEGLPTTLIDGFITHQQYAPTNGPDDSTFVVTGEDVSVQMDLLELSREFPGFDDPATVEEVLAPYDLLGLVPLVIPPESSLVVPIDYVPQQAGTDRAYLQQLAQQNGYLFYVTPTALPLVNTAYWGPPIRFGFPSAVLDVAVGAASTVDGFQAQYDALAPVTYYGAAIETLLEPYAPVPIATLTGTRMPPLATNPALGVGALLGLNVKRELWKADDVDPVLAEIRAQAATDLSTDSVVTITCDVSPVRLGSIVSAPGLVGVRGTGEDYDGLYYLRSATHTINLLHDEQWNYTQSLTLAREGVGTTTDVLEVI